MKKSTRRKLGDAVDNMKDTVEELLDKTYEEGHQAGYEEGEPAAMNLLEFAIEQFKEMNIRGISPEQMLAELESELCRHMPVTGPTLFSK